jgi:hypothetical protein
MNIRISSIHVFGHSTCVCIDVEGFGSMDVRDAIPMSSVDSLLEVANKVAIEKLSLLVEAHNRERELLEESKKPKSVGWEGEDLSGSVEDLPTIQEEPDDTER